jgi:hypothetical protein
MSQWTTAAALTDGVGTYVGGGTTSPGLSLNPTMQTVAGSGTLVGVVSIATSIVPVVDSCSFSGSTTSSSLASSAGGSITATCTGSVSISAALSYSRTGVVVTLSGSGTINGTSPHFNGVCAFVPTSAPTVTTYELACAVAASDTV